MENTQEKTWSLKGFSVYLFLRTKSLWVSEPEAELSCLSAPKSLFLVPAEVSALELSYFRRTPISVHIEITALPFWVTSQE